MPKLTLESVIFIAHPRLLPLQPERCHCYEGPVRNCIKQAVAAGFGAHRAWYCNKNVTLYVEKEQRQG
jgi:hypothetical protein